jgi:uncharacterized membrane protein
MKSRLQFAGHPLHPMVVAFPIALYVTGFICDVLFALLHDPFWASMAFWSLVFGVIGNLGAAVTGLPDYLAILRERSDARRVANSHLVFGVSLVVVQSLNAVIHAAGDASSGRSTALSLIVDVIALGLLGLQGWYGGELVYRYRIGVAEPEVTAPLGTGKHKKHH